MRTASVPPASPHLDLQHTEQLLHFYGSSAERLRGVKALTPGNASEIVLATTRPSLAFFDAAFRELGLPMSRINLVEITSDWHRGLNQMLDAVLHAQQTRKSVCLLADFADSVHLQAVYELESLIRSAAREWKVRCITQYDLRHFAEGIDVSALSRFGVVMVGHYFARGNAAPRHDHELVSVARQEQDSAGE